MRDGGYKAVVVGAGQVGATTAYTLMLSGLLSELILIDVNRDKARGEALDIAHGIPLCPPALVRLGDYPDCAGADIVIISAGLNQKPGETRVDLLGKNRRVFASVVPEIVKYTRDALLLVVTNPVDALTLETIRLSGYPKERVIGSGTVLDTSRTRYMISTHTGVDPRDIRAYVLGEHGDSELPVWSRTLIGGMSIDEYCAACGKCDGRLSKWLRDNFDTEVRGAAYNIISLKGATYYAVALAVRRVVEAVLRDEHSLLTVSTLATGEYGIDGVCLSMPAVIGAGGVEKVLDMPLDDGELALLRRSAETIRAFTQS